MSFVWWWLGCGSAKVDGEVVDAAGSPVEGATIALSGGSCLGTSDAHGRFSVPCAPGHYDVSVGKAGYVLDDKLVVDAPEREHYDLGRRTLVRIPEANGLFIYLALDYQPLPPAFVSRDKAESHTKETKTFCLEAKKSQYIEMGPGVHQIFDNHNKGWKIWKLDTAGCAYRASSSDGHEWKVDYGSSPDMQVRELGGDKRLALVDLPIGDYFVADWRADTFVQSPDDHALYTGGWLRVREMKE